MGFIGPDRQSRVLVAPESVVISFILPPPEEDDRQRVIGFSAPTETDEG